MALAVIGLLAALGAGVWALTSGGSNPTAGPRVVATIDLAAASPVNCSPPIPPGAGHPQTVLSQLFAVTDSAHVPYLLGWEIVPYRASVRSYHFGPSGAVLALEPAGGGAPLGYGRGAIAFTAAVATGSVDAVVDLKTGGEIRVSGRWSCSARSSGATPAT